MLISRTLIAAVAIASGVFAATANAGTDTNVSAGLTTKGPGLAAHGFDVVGYFTQNQPIFGSASHSTVYKDATYRFASAENLRAFEANPAKYVPQYGGYCAYGVSVGVKFDGDPRLWKVVDGKLYFNLNEDIQKLWFKDIPSNITWCLNSTPRKCLGFHTPAEAFLENLRVALDM